MYRVKITLKFYYMTEKAGQHTTRKMSFGEVPAKLSLE